MTIGKPWGPGALWPWGYGTASVAAVLVVLGIGLSATAPPSLQQVIAAHRPSDLRLLDRHGEALSQRRVAANLRRWMWTPLAHVSPVLLQTVVEVEDKRFWTHSGVDPRAVAAAILGALRGQHRGGASTITMQLARWLDPELKGRPRGLAVARKWRQMRSAWALERAWSKAEILEAYLNVVAYRGEIHGVGAAAAILFGKAAHGLDRGESFVLAALLRDPTAAAPRVAARARKLAAPQSDLHRIAEVDAAVQRLQSAQRMDVDDLAPHVATRLLGNGVTADVSTTLDRQLQGLALASLHRHLLDLRARHVEDGAVLVADNHSGAVLAYVGSSGSLSAAPHVDAVLARRQAGSTLKPFLYAVALEQRLLTAASLLDDSPVEIAESSGVYRPENYDRHFRGIVTLRTALAGSINVPAVRTLMLLDADAFLGKLQRLGFERLGRPGHFYGPALALGAVDVNLWELVDAYRTLANQGQYSPIHLQPDATSSVRAIDAAAAFIVTDILADRESRAGTFGLDSPLSTSSWTAVKTGTSKDMRDNWCIGFSDRYTVGVWVGNASGAPMHDVTGVSGAALIWHDIVESLHRESPSHAPREPEGVTVQWSVFPQTAEPARREWFVPGTEPQTREVILAGRRDRIVTPVHGTIVAIDPDIAPARQRIRLQAETAEGDRRWAVDGVDLGSTGTAAWWTPQPGPHILSLHDRNGRQLDAVKLRVRGTWPVTQTTRGEPTT